jgi:hypothetical protein
MPADVRIIWKQSEIAALVSSRGPVAADLLRRGHAVRNEALSNMRRMRIGAKVGTGALAQSLVVEFASKGKTLVVRVGSRLPYAIYVHEGHGIIRPVRGRFLRWPAVASSGSPRRYKGGKTARYVYARQVRAVAGKPFLREALPAAAR